MQGFPVVQLDLTKAVSAAADVSQGLLRWVKVCHQVGILVAVSGGYPAFCELVVGRVDESASNDTPGDGRRTFNQSCGLASGRRVRNNDRRIAGHAGVLGTGRQNHL